MADIEIYPAVLRVTKEDVVKIASLCIDGLKTDGTHHKQWFLEQILEVMGVNVENWREKAEWDKGVAP